VKNTGKMMTKREIAEKYIGFLSNGDIEGIVSLFAENGKVDSPLYGIKEANEFFKELIGDTTNSELKLKGIFEDFNSDSLALYFGYKWTVKSGKIAEFDVVDILDFDEKNKIVKLKIIYDTVVSRNLIEEMKK
jgi:ketosteroid isomerase-like protein